MATGNGHSDSRVGEGGRLKGGRKPGGEAQPGDDRLHAKTASPSFHMNLTMRFCLQVLNVAALETLHRSVGTFMFKKVFSGLRKLYSLLSYASEGTF